MINDRFHLLHFTLRVRHYKHTLTEQFVEYGVRAREKTKSTFKKTGISDWRQNCEAMRNCWTVVEHTPVKCYLGGYVVSGHQCRITAGKGSVVSLALQ